MQGKESSIKLSGIPVSEGVAIGTAYVLAPPGTTIPIYRINTDDDVDNEIKRFREAVDASINQIKSIFITVEQTLDSTHANIFKSHTMILQDPLLIDETIAEIKKEKMNAEYIFSRSVDKIITLFSKINDEYIADRVKDIKDVAKRVIDNLTNIETPKVTRLPKKSIIIAHDLSPSDTVHIDKSLVLGFATEIGGPTSHTAILAKALELPAVVGVKDLLLNVKTGDSIILNGSQGTVIVSPTKEDERKHNQLKEKLIENVSSLSKLKTLPAETIDGYKIEIAANLEFKDEVHHAIENGAESIGLFRTEFLYLESKELPNEEKQFKVYSEVVKSLKGKSIIFRTLDIGGDKFLSNLPITQKLNPYLGLRAIRLCLANPEIFKIQLRAILRASAFGDAKIMFPMISGLTEVRLAKQYIEDCKEELKAKKQAYNDKIEVGIMIEIPSAALTSDILAKEVDFFSIGTNDLIQYTLAVDRGNESVAQLYQPYHPSVLRLIRTTINAGHREDIWVGLCGEMASDPITAIILLGLGIDELSMSSAAILNVKKVIRSIRLSDARKLADELLQRSCVKDIKNTLKPWVNQNLKGLVSFPE